MRLWTSAKNTSFILKSKRILKLKTRISKIKISKTDKMSSWKMCWSWRFLSIISEWSMSTWSSTRSACSDIKKLPRWWRYMLLRTRSLPIWKLHVPLRRSGFSKTLEQEDSFHKTQTVASNEKILVRRGRRCLCQIIWSLTTTLVKIINRMSTRQIKSRWLHRIQLEQRPADHGRRRNGKP